MNSFVLKDTWKVEEEGLDVSIWSLSPCLEGYHQVKKKLLSVYLLDNGWRDVLACGTYSFFKAVLRLIGHVWGERLQVVDKQNKRIPGERSKKPK